jgi:predicted PurR-regulated permease PerM
MQNFLLFLIAAYFMPWLWGVAGIALALFLLYLGYLWADDWI